VAAVKVGTWTSSTAVEGFSGEDYLHDGNTGKGSKTVTFTPTIPTTGTYDVSIWYIATPTRSSNTPVSIVHAGGTSNVTVNQRINGLTWVPLGSYTFNAGTAGSVTIGNAGTDGFVIADAIRFSQ